MKRQLLAAGAAISAMMLAGAVVAQSNGLGLLRAIQAGQWELKDRDSEAVRRICVRSGEAFVQLRHSGSSCRRVAVEENGRTVTVQYACGRDGYGRTTIRIESPELVQIETQGTARGAPFQYSAEARRVGACR
jgi:hypothetical protein